jgi:hypothetical protein
MDVQTRLITHICPHYAEHVWQKILKKEGFAIKAGWPAADTPDSTLEDCKQILAGFYIFDEEAASEARVWFQEAQEGSCVCTSIRGKEVEHWPHICQRALLWLERAVLEGAVVQVRQPYTNLCT